MIKSKLATLLFLYTALISNAKTENTINSLESFKYYYNNIDTFIYGMFFLMKEDIIPLWEDEKNINEMVFKDPYPSFNFSRVAGCSGLEEQIRKFGSIIHIYGHQHRNRHRVVDNILYISHCLGSPMERKYHLVGRDMDGPKLIWE